MDGGSSDNCSGLIFSASQTTFTCADLGANNVTVTVADGAGNFSTCVAVVTVLDRTPPVLNCLGDQEELAVANCRFTLPDYTGLVAVNDNCAGSLTVTQSPIPGSVIGLGATTITLIADDGNGNTTPCAFKVMVSSSATGTLDSTICNGVSFTFNGTLYDGTNTSGVETLVGAAANGCDSLVTVTITELPALTSIINETICYGDSLVVNDIVYKKTVIGATQVFTNVGPNKCDSIVIINLTVKPVIDLSVTNSSPVLTANQAGGNIPMARLQ